MNVPFTHPVEKPVEKPVENSVYTCGKLIKNHKNLSPFLIFHGEQGCGKILAAQKFAAFLLNEPVEKLQKNPLHHYRYINFDDAEIKIDILPNIRDFLEHKNDQYKILIIDNADNLNLHASNSLLKIFEHHYQKTFIILIVHNIHKFPKTLRSRFFEIEFQGEIQDDELSRYTQGNQKLLSWVLKHDGLLLIQKLKRLMSLQQTTLEHEEFMQKYKKEYSYILMLMRIILYISACHSERSEESIALTNKDPSPLAQDDVRGKKIKAFSKLNKFILRSDHTHIPMEDYIYMGFLLCR